MAIVTIRELSIAYGSPALLDHVSCEIEPGQRIGLLGRNGSGKSTLLAILAGQVESDAGQVLIEAGKRISLLQQEVPADLVGSVREVVAGGLPAHPDGDHAEWQSAQQVERIMTRVALDGDARVESLSTGMKRRVLLARALVAEPELLLLDEPTNHLDVDAIEWLEEFLLRWDHTLIFVTHDRAFLRRLASRILEIDRGQLFDWAVDYETFLVRKEAMLEAEERQDALFDKKLAREEAWIRQGIKARRTRNEGRVRALERMRRERQTRTAPAARMQLEIQDGSRSGTLVAKLDGVSFAYGDGAILTDFSTTILRGDKVGIVGANGAGKTTLLRLVLGHLEPDAGTVKLGTNLQIAYFDQVRDQLDLDASVAENVGDGADTIQVDGRTRYISGYLEDFLFSRERSRMPVRLLSGGERNRLLLARLFAKPANVIVLDEPTNDLDTESLELLEERLVAWDGTVLVVSHDREFLDNVVTSTIAFDPQGAREYSGGYSDWVRQRPSASPAPRELPAKKRAGTDREPPSGQARRRLSYKEAQELAGLPEIIAAHEAEIADLHDAMAQPDFFKQPREHIVREQERLAEAERRLAATLARWEDLEARTG